MQFFSNQSFFTRVLILIPADSWPQVFDDSEARRDWNWKPEVDLDNLVKLMVKEVKEKIAANGLS